MSRKTTAARRMVGSDWGCTVYGTTDVLLLQRGLAPPRRAGFLAHNGGTARPSGAALSRVRANRVVCGRVTRTRALLRRPLAHVVDPGLHRRLPVLQLVRLEEQPELALGAFG